MNLFTRLSATLSSRLEQTVSHIENHDAIIDAALRQSRIMVTASKQRLARLINDGEALQAGITALEAEIESWTVRARNSAASDEALALQCLQRRKQCNESLTRTRRDLVSHRSMETTLRQRVSEAEEHLSSLTRQHNQLRSRESTAEALRIIDAVRTRAPRAIDEQFDRWEISVGAQELETGGGTLDSGLNDNRCSTDALDEQFRRQEENAELRRELAGLLSADALDSSAEQHNA